MPIGACLWRDSSLCGAPRRDCSRHHMTPMCVSNFSVLSPLVAPPDVFYLRRQVFMQLFGKRFALSPSKAHQSLNPLHPPHPALSFSSDLAVASHELASSEAIDASWHLASIPLEKSVEYTKSRGPAE